MIFTAFEVYVKLVKQSSHNFQIHRFAYLLSELGLKIDFPGTSKLEDVSQYLAFIIPPILIAFKATIGMADSRNTEFAIWCAKGASKEVG
jgi:hypothetical protein